MLTPRPVTAPSLEHQCFLSVRPLPLRPLPLRPSPRGPCDDLRGRAGQLSPTLASVLQRRAAA